MLFAGNRFLKLWYNNDIIDYIITVKPAHGLIKEVQHVAVHVNKNRSEDCPLSLGAIVLLYSIQTHSITTPSLYTTVY